MFTEQNKALVRHWVNEVINNQKLDLIDELHAANYINHHLPPGLPQGPEGEKIFSRMFFQAFPDGKFDIQHMLAEGDRVAMRYIYSGTQTGAFMTIPATGKHVSVAGINFLRVADDKIAENWINLDEIGLMQQLGIAPAMGPAFQPPAKPTSATATRAATSLEENKKLVRHLFEEGFNTGNLRVADELLDANYVNYDFTAPVPGREGYKQVQQLFRAAFPDMCITIEDELAEGDSVATRGYYTGTHKGEFLGIPPTGKQVKVVYADLWHIVNGKLLENWVNQDLLGMMQQLGVIPTPA